MPLYKQGSGLVIRSGSLGASEACCCEQDGTCCRPDGTCLDGGPGRGCFPTGSPEDDGCWCDEFCYVNCFDCCGDDAPECCTWTPEVSSIHDTSGGHAKQRLDAAVLEREMGEYGVDIDECWGAALQSGTVLDGYYHMNGHSRLSLILCLQDMAAGAVPWIAISAHRMRVVSAVNAVRMARI